MTATTLAECGEPFRTHVVVVTIVVLLRVGYVQGEDTNDDLKDESDDDQRDDRHVESARITVQYLTSYTTSLNNHESN